MIMQAGPERDRQPLTQGTPQNIISVFLIETTAFFSPRSSILPSAEASD